MLGQSVFLITSYSDSLLLCVECWAILHSVSRPGTVSVNLALESITGSNVGLNILDM